MENAGFQPPVLRQTIGGEEVNAVNARELWQALEVGKDFSNWIKDRIDKYGFQEGKDFSPELAKSSGGRPSIEYIITMDMGKELCMVENNEQGKKIRRYFIECERKAKQLAPQDTLSLLKLAVGEIEAAQERNKLLSAANHALETQKETLELNNKALAPAAEYTSTVLLSSTIHAITNVAKMKEIGVSAIELNKWLSFKELVYRQGKHWYPKALWDNRGLFGPKIYCYRIDADGTKHTRSSLGVTEKGRMFLVKCWQQNQSKPAAVYRETFPEEFGATKS